MLSFLLFKRIAELFIVIFLGWSIVKAGILKSEDSRCISMILLYIITPCVVIHSFQIQRTPETLQMMGLTVLAALVLNVLLVVLGSVFARLLHLDVVEKASIIYPNTGNLAIPLVGKIFGPEWVVYVTIYNMVQIIFIWTHGRILISGKKKVALRDIFGNVNIIAIAVGLLLFAFQLRLPEIMDDAFSMVSDMVGPAAMLITGMLMAGIDRDMLKTYRRVWKPVVLRLVVVSFLLTVLLKYGGLAALAPNGDTLLLIGLLGTTAPSASTVTQFSQMFGQDARYSSLINAATMLLCIITIPLMTAFYQM